MARKHKALVSFLTTLSLPSVKNLKSKKFLPFTDIIN